MRVWAVALGGRLVSFAALWWAMVEGDASQLGYGVLAVPLASAASLWLVPPQSRPGSPRERAAALASLFAWFVAQSLRGGVDVARRAVSRPLDLDSGYVEHRLRLPTGLARVAVADLMNLMPGSLCVAIDDDVLRLHVLDVSMPVLAQVAELERRIASVAGHPPE